MSRDAEETQIARADFFSELQRHQITAREMFDEELLQIIARRLGWDQVVTHYFDTTGVFLASRDLRGLRHADEGDPYEQFVANDVVRHAVRRDARRDHLTYFNTTPRLYKSTDIIDPVDYEGSAYVRFLEENYGAHYSVVLAFGINAYITLMFYKTAAEGDFTDDEIDELEWIYTYVASSYKTFKKYEQVRIVSDLQGDIIASGEKAFLITDDAMHVLNYNKVAEAYLEDLLGHAVIEQLASDTSCTWLPFLLGGEPASSPEEVRTQTIKDYTFRVHNYDRTYSNGIIDRYHWITISAAGESSPRVADDEEGPEPVHARISGDVIQFTRTERKVAELMRQGLTYQEVAKELVISFHTVKKHVQNIYGKCGVNSRFELYRWLEEHDFR